MLRNFGVSTDRDTVTRTIYNRALRMVDGDLHGTGEIVTYQQEIVMPPDTLAIRAGEYGLDPADVALLLDVVLHENFITYPEDAHPLFSAASIALAREQHLDMVATVRAEQAALGAELVRPKGYPTAATHRAALLATAERMPIYPERVTRARQTARDNWALIQKLGALPVPEPGRGLLPQATRRAR